MVERVRVRHARERERPRGRDAEPPTLPRLLRYLERGARASEAVRTEPSECTGLTLKVLLDALRRDRLGEDDDPALNLPGDEHLGGGRAVRGRNVLDDRVRKLGRAGRAEGGVRFEEDAVVVGPLQGMTRQFLSATPEAPNVGPAGAHLHKLGLGTVEVQLHLIDGRLDLSLQGEVGAS